MIHRDIKPENILLQAGKRWSPTSASRSRCSRPAVSGMTQTGMSLGTPQYMSPEQAMGDRTIDARTDIYALGALRMRCWRASRRSPGPTHRRSSRVLLTEKPRPPRAASRNGAAAGRSGRAQALQKLPADRFANAAAFASALASSNLLSTHAEVVGRVRESDARATRFSWQRVTVRPLAAVAILASGYFVGRRAASSTEFATEWHGELLGGPQVAMNGVVSRDGKMVAFQALTDGLTQLAVIKPQSGDWKVLTTSRSQGLLSSISWARDDSRIYFDRFIDVPGGIYSVSPLGGDERLVLADAAIPDILPDGSLLVARLNANRDMQMYRYWPEKGRLDTLGRGRTELARQRILPFVPERQGSCIRRTSGERKGLVEPFLCHRPRDQPRSPARIRRRQVVVFLGHAGQSVALDRVA